ncbi:MAG: hypothetical protein PHU80_03570 [Kiritimatiellae bacterium]|nr:hypothetical protein [Kiritimatiellia bacterium]
MRKLDLSGDWSVRKQGSKKVCMAQVPGCVYTDLLAARELEDPAVGSNIAKMSWVAEHVWLYEKFFIAEEFVDSDVILLRFEGLASGAEVLLNGSVLGGSRSFHVPIEFDVREHMRKGKNHLEVKIPACATIVDGKSSGGCEIVPGFSVTDLTRGIWRDVALRAFKSVRVQDILIKQDHAAGGGVGLTVTVLSERFDPDLHLEILARVCYKGSIMHEVRAILDSERKDLEVTVKNPQLWWPSGLGEQPLYEVTVDVLAGRTCLEHVSRRIGLRDFRIEQAKSAKDRKLRFLINGQNLFLKGASWYPADIFLSRLTRVEYAGLIKAAAVANINCLRVWGGGIYESDAFYNLCDEYGVCVWQDVMLPANDSGKLGKMAMSAFEKELQEVMCRVRHHPSLVIWGGSASAGCDSAAYEKALSCAAAECTPGSACMPFSAHMPFSLGCEVRDDNLPAYPEPRVVSEYLTADARNVSHPECVLHMDPAGGAELLYRGFVREFLMPSGFDNVLWLSQIQQALAVKRQMQHARCGSLHSPGFIFWRLNECWCGGSPASLDYRGNWKALHYFTRRFFATPAVCGVYDAKLGSVDIHVFNDGLKAFRGEVQWRTTDMEGQAVLEGTRKVTVSATAQEIACAVKVGEVLRKKGQQNLLLWVYLLDEQGNQLSWDIVNFCVWREMSPLPPRIRAEIRTWDDNSFAVTLTSHHPALWVWISLDGMGARCDDNFVCLEPDKPLRIRVTPAVRLKLDQFRSLIRIKTLRDTWQEKQATGHIMPAAARRGHIV